MAHLAYHNMTVLINNTVFDSHKDLIINLYGYNILNNTVRNHSSFVKDNVPMPGANFGIDVSLGYTF